MNTIRPPEPERRVAPIDGGGRTRVKPGLRREQPRDWLEEREAAEDFQEELARREREGGEAPREAALEAEEGGQPQDRVEIAGITATPAPEAPEPGSRLDVKA
jgi:hypothetical protein